MATKWTTESVKAVLEGASFRIVEQKPIAHGVQFVLGDGTRVNVFPSTGKTMVQGRNTIDQQKVQDLLTDLPVPMPSGPTIAATTLPPSGLTPTHEPPKKVFIVYGHDTRSRDDLELLLRRLGLQPFILSNQAPDGKTIIEALFANSEAGYAIVLLTPDDEGHRAGAPQEKRFRARQNVVLELGMFLMKLGREKVAILHKGNIELPSDISGLIYIQFTASIGETKNKLAAALQKAGFYIDIAALSAE